MRVARVIEDALLCAMYSANMENTLFEDGDCANTFRACYTSQSENMCTLGGIGRGSKCLASRFLGYKGA
jgi:hypothetical protein